MRHFVVLSGEPFLSTHKLQKSLPHKIQQQRGIFNTMGYRIFATRIRLKIEVAYHSIQVDAVMFSAQAQQKQDTDGDEISRNGNQIY